MKKFFITLLCSLIAGLLSAQWTSDTGLNTLVAASEAEDMESVGTSDGRTYVAYWHSVPAPQFYEMRLQLLDQEGNKLFGPEGMLVNGSLPMSSYTTLWSISLDAEDNVFVCFNASGGNTEAYVHKISPDGTQLWGDSGVLIGQGYDVKALPLSNGEVIISWLPGNEGVMQKYDAGGNAIWANPVVIQPPVTGQKTSAGEMAELSNGDFILVLHARSGFGISSLPYAQRYNAAGNPVWTAPVALTNNVYLSFNRRYPLRQDADVLYFGYSGAVGLKFYSYLQRINPDGALPWGLNGSDFSTQDLDYERETEIAFSEGSGYVWAICEYTDPSQGNAGEYVQKFDKETGARQLTDLGKQVFPISSDYVSHRGDLQLVNDKPLFVVSDGSSNGVFPLDLLAVYLDENGDFAWPEQTRPVATNEDGVKGRVQLNRPAAGNAVCVWTDDRTGIYLPYAQRVEVACQAPAAGFTFTVTDLTAVFSSSAMNADSVAWDFGDGQVASGENATHTYAESGTFTVCQYVFNECGEDSFCQEVTVMSTGVADWAARYGIRLYPNPGDGAFFVEIELQEAAEVSVGLHSANGTKMEERIQRLTAGRSVISGFGSELPAGTYWVRIRVNQEMAAIPLVVEK